jgi:hypothetical protein
LKKVLKSAREALFFNDLDLQFLVCVKRKLKEEERTGSFGLERKKEQE